MAGWEIALIIVAVTYMVVNMVSVRMSIKLMSKMDGYLTKGVKLVEKWIDYSDKATDKMFKEFLDEDEL